MAEIPVEKKSSMAWLWILLALLVAVLLIWWALDSDDPAPVAAAPVAAAPAAIAPAEMAPLPEPVAQSSGRSIADIMGNPTGFVGQTFSDDSVEVPGVPTDRGFWIRDNGAQMFAVLIDKESEAPKDINPGQMLRVREGIPRDATALQQNQIPGTLDADTRRIIEQQPIFLVVEEENVEILTRPGGAAGTEVDVDQGRR